MHFRQQNFAQKVAQFLGDFGVLKFSPWPLKSSPKGEISPNLVTLLFAGTAFLWNGYEPATAGECHVVNLKSQVLSS